MSPWGLILSLLGTIYRVQARMHVLFGMKLEGGSGERKTWKGAVWVVWGDVMGVWPQDSRVEQGWIPLS